MDIAVDQALFYLLIADSLLAIHVLFVLFVIFSLIFVYVGKWLAWQWVKNPWFRSIHILCIGVVVVQSWLGIICPLTIWEMAYRAKAGDTVYAGSFISYWLSELLYYQAPAWVFMVIYTLFGSLVVLSWWYVRPRSFTQ